MVDTGALMTQDIYCGTVDVGPLFRIVDTAEHRLPPPELLFAILRLVKHLLLGLSPALWGSLPVPSQMQSHPAGQGLNGARVRVPQGGLGHLSIGVPAGPGARAYQGPTVSVSGASGPASRLWCSPSH